MRTIEKLAASRRNRRLFCVAIFHVSCNGLTSSLVSLEVAGTTTWTNEASQAIIFGSSFATAPLVIAQTMTNNDPAAVTERVRTVSTTGFQIQFNEEEVADGTHATETVGYIAIDQGAATTGATSLNAVTTGNIVTHQNTTVTFGMYRRFVQPSHSL